MDPSHDFGTVAKPAFTALLKQYPNVVPSKLSELEKERLETIPAALEKRRKDEKAVYLTKPELATLMKWKLSHGKFRPQLAALIDQNSPETVLKTTTTAFALFTLSDSPDAGTFKSALTTLTALRGVGPATASLLLSVLSPASAPFFSDELFRWAFYSLPDGGGGKGDVKGKGKGWKREIKYSLAEYLALVERLQGVRERLGVGCLEVEMVGYVLGKTAAGSAGGKVAAGGSVGEAKEAQKRKVEGGEGGAADSLPSSSGSKKAKTVTKTVETGEDGEISSGLRRSTRGRK